MSDRLINSKNIILNSQATTKAAAFAEVAALAENLGYVADKAELIAGLQARESQAATGLEDGFAIPHAKIPQIKQPGIIFVRYQNPLEWQTFDNSLVTIAIFLLIPADKSSSIHLAILSDIATRLLKSEVRQSLKTTNDKQQIINLLMQQPAKVETTAAQDKNSTKQYIVAVTGCPAGVAHTYMAAQKILEYGQAQGYEVKVEKQGANGIEDKLTTADIQRAQVLIIAADINPAESERFADIPTVRVAVKDPIHNIKKVYDQAIKIMRTDNITNNTQPQAGETDEQKPGTNSKNWFKIKFKKSSSNLKNAVLTGISFAVPVIVAGTVIVALVTIINQIWGAETIIEHANWLNEISDVAGAVLGTLLAPILAAYIAYGLADKPGLTPGFLGGLACNYIIKYNPNNHDMIIVNGLGFLGGLITGIIVGYLMIFMKKYLVNKKIQGVLTWFVYPVLSSLIIIVIILFAIGQPLASLIALIFGGLTALQNSNAAFIMGALVGIMCVFDLGGPFNKVAWAFSWASFSQAVQSGNASLLVPYACFWVAGIGTGWTTFLVTTIGRKFANKYEKDAGKLAWILSSLGITEGAIPFALSDPFRVIPSFMVGGAVSGGLCAYFSLGSTISGGGFITMAGMQSANGSFSVGVAILLWFIIALVGSLLSTTLILSLKYLKTKPELEKKIRTISLNIITLGMIKMIKPNKASHLKEKSKDE